jgi:cytochrome c553
MLFNKKITVVVTLLILVLAGIAASKPPKPIYKNLKVLPKNISHEDLDKVMDQFKSSLGVRCNFCHAPSKEDPKKMDFASDDKPEKGIARDMMRMTLKLNKKYFDYKPKDTSSVAAVGCYTCHHGKEHPEKSAPKGEGGPRQGGGQRPPAGPPPTQGPATGAGTGN